MSIHPPADEINPAQSKGSVMSSGSKVVSQSMNARATRAAEKPHQAKPVGVRPHWCAQKANSTAVRISTSG